MNKMKPNQEDNSGKSEVSVIGKPITVNEVIINSINYLLLCCLILIACNYLFFK